MTSRDAVYSSHHILSRDSYKYDPVVHPHGHYRKSWRVIVLLCYYWPSSEGGVGVYTRTESIRLYGPTALHRTARPPAPFLIRHYRIGDLC